MNLDELKSLWQEGESGLAKRARLNTRLLDKIEAQNVRSTVKPLMVENVIVAVLHLLVIIGLLLFLVHHLPDIHYTGSALILLGYYFFLLVNTGRQIKELKSVGRSNDLLSLQTSLTRLRTHKLEFVRLSVLTIPAFLSFPVVVPQGLADLNIDVFNGFDIVKQTHGTWWLVEMISCLVLIPLGVWFYMQVRPENVHKNWVKNLIKRTTGKRVYKASQYLNELYAMKVHQ